MVGGKGVGEGGDEMVASRVKYVFYKSRRRVELGGREGFGG